ncbi:chemotaxis protein CheA [Gluconobacter frateurii]|uniref:Chemotaxis protein CheA n=1 Tax=Gluconobacter frateurii NRIC 0228 TaxID=1307946 RepID=A0ABQ0Q7W0_9PROT|nr:chemotaxis protein CheA [Gluconobacter frateurii]GBR08313.1 chemotaxis protein CheA [Gluconobacter frateurii NRIC 0228]GLP91127.1 chemotaxis protein CheA [Gluconobacter frateurii]
MNNDVEADDLESIRLIFFEECGEQLSLLEDELSSLNAETGPGEKINTIFRAVHSIKGGAGAFGMEKLVRFSHLFEAVLEKFRSGECTIDHASVATFLKAADVLADIVGFYRDGRDLTVQDDVVEELDRYLNAPQIVLENTDVVDPLPEDIDGFSFTPVKIDFPEEQKLHLEITPKIGLYKSGDDIRNILSFLEKKGRIEVELYCNNVPALEEFNINDTYSVWNVQINSCEDKNSLEEVFEWSGSNIEVKFIDKKINENKLEKINSNKKEEINNEFLKIENSPKNLRKENPTIRVDTKRVDKLVDLLSELVINQGAIRSQMKANDIRPGSALDIVISELDQLTHELQENVMAMRAHPIKTVFQRMGRIVRETSRISGKDVTLHLEGEDTEVDRSILEKLSDPLTHMVRNAIDHGLESEDIRVAAGKPAEGKVSLRAFHRSGRIIIEVEDDGSGLNCDKIYKKAISKGIINSSYSMEKEEIQNLIFEPGFSTVENVSDLSGRGVGMDVVRKSISEIGGRISILTEENKGTLFSISLPLTLAVVEGLIFRTQEQNFIVPVSGVVEAFLFQESKKIQISEDIWGYPYRDEYIPIMHSKKLTKKEKKDVISNSCLVIENEKKEKLAIIVDDIIDQSRFVVKSIEKNYRKIPGFSSATILGDGGVALIVDVDFLIESVSGKKFVRSAE